MEEHFFELCIYSVGFIEAFVFRSVALETLEEGLYLRYLFKIRIMWNGLCTPIEQDMGLAVLLISSIRAYKFVLCSRLKLLSCLFMYNWRTHAVPQYTNEKVGFADL